MKRAIKCAIAATSLMLAMSSPVFAENGTSGMTGTGSTGTSAYTGQTLNGAGSGTGAGRDLSGGNNAYANRDSYASLNRSGVDMSNPRATGINGNNGSYRRYGMNAAGSGNDNMNSGRLRANAANTADNDMDWGWLGLLGLLGLAGLRNRNRQTS